MSTKITGLLDEHVLNTTPVAISTATEWGDLGIGGRVWV